MLIWNVQYQQKQLQVIQCKNCSGVQNQEEYMKLVLKNIGKVQNATVEINGITVIAGENDTGKSTVGKALFSVFNSLYNIDEKITAERERSVFNQLQAMSREAPFGDYIHISPSELIKEINTPGKDTKTRDELQKAVFDAIVSYGKIPDDISKDTIKATAERIVMTLSVPDGEILKSVLQKNLDIEFCGQVGNIYCENESSIQLEIRGKSTEVIISGNRVADVINPTKLGTEVIYIDDPFVLDELSGIPGYIIIGESRYPDHRKHLEYRLRAASRTNNVVDEIVTNEKLDQIYQKISTVCEGDVVGDKRATVGYQVGDHRLDVKNMSTGLKTFAILKSCYIKTRGVIILDEPEIHLHPEWQLLFAELIVLLHKEFGLHILLNTHSPYFLNAIEVYSAKYQVADKCKYYLTENVNKLSYIKDVTDDIEAIYRKLARPLQKLENERYADE